MSVFQCVCVCVYSRSTHRCFVCVCVCMFEDEASGWKVLQYGLRSILAKKHFKVGGTDLESPIRPLWSIKLHYYLKAKTYRGSAPIVC